MFIQELAEDMRFDGFLLESRDREEFKNAVDTMQSGTVWYPIPHTRELSVMGLLPMDLLCGECGSLKTRLLRENPEDLVYETASERGSRMMLVFGGKGYLLRPCAVASLHDTAKISGTALGKISPDEHAAILNICFPAANGSGCACVKHGKLVSTMSSGYEVLPAGDVLETAEEVLVEKLGEMEFVSGCLTHDCTAEILEFPEAQDELLERYHRIQDQYPHLRTTNIMPAVRISTSDARNSAAAIQPMFRIRRGIYSALCRPIRVEHRVRSGCSGLDLLRQEAKTVFSRFDETMETIERLSASTVYYPGQAIRRLMKKAGFPGKCISRSLASHAMFGSGQCTAYDCYLSICDCMAGSSGPAREELQDLAAKTLSYDWSESDYPAQLL